MLQSSENKGMSILSGEASKSTFVLDSRNVYKDNIDEKMNYFHMCVMEERMNIKEMEYTNRLIKNALKELYYSKYDFGRNLKMKYTIESV